MNKIFSAVFIISILPAVTFTFANAWTKFTKSVVNQQNGISYKRLGSSYFGRRGTVSQILCAHVCMNEDSCKSVYVDGETCVFGVDDVTAFEEGELVTPDLNQVLRVKGKHIQCCLCFYGSAQS